MDDEKSIVEKITDTVKGLVDTASAAAMKALEPDEPAVTKKQVYIPEATDATVMPAPLISTPKARKKTSPDMSGRITPNYDFPAPQSKMPGKVKAAKKSAKKPKTTAAKPANKSAKKSAKKSATKKAAKKKKWKSPAKAVAKKKAAKKIAKKKKAKKSKR